MKKQEILEKVYDYQISEIPVGEIAVLTAGVAASKAVSGFIAGSTGFSPAATKAIIALACFKWKPIQKALGPGAAKLLGVGLAATAVNDEWQIDQKVEDTVYKWFNKAKEIASGTAAQTAVTNANVVTQAETVAADYIGAGA